MGSKDERKTSISDSIKPSMLVLDFVGKNGEHKLMSTADILGGNVSDEAIERAIVLAKKNGESVRMADALDEAQEQIRQEAERRRQQEEARKAKVVAKVSYSIKKINPFDVFDIQPAKERGWDFEKTLSVKQRALLLKQGINPDEMGYAQGRQLINEMFRRWKGKLCTLKQANLLKRYNYQTKDMTMQEASSKIDALVKNGWKRPSEEPKPKPDNVPF
jgi:hypothetical protein